MLLLTVSMPAWAFVLIILFLAICFTVLGFLTGRFIASLNYFGGSRSHRAANAHEIPFNHNHQGRN